MKRKITFFVLFLVAAAFLFSLLTGCTLTGEPGQNTGIATEFADLEADECPALLNDALTASLRKESYSIRIVGNGLEFEDDSRSSYYSVNYTTVIEFDGNVRHVVSRKEGRGGVSAYSETYLFERDGDYYSSTRDSENGAFVTTAFSLKATYDAEVAKTLLGTVVGETALTASAGATYTGTRWRDRTEINTSASVTFDGLAAKKDMFFTVRDGLIGSFVMRISAFLNDDDARTGVSEESVTITYDIDAITLDAGITVE